MYPAGEGFSTPASGSSRKRRDPTFGEALTQVATTAASLLALVLSTLNLYLQRKDRRPRLGMRVRYEYRVGGPEMPGEDEALPRIHDDSQERLYMLLGDFLKEHGIDYPQGVPLVRFALSNEGERPIYLHSLRLTFYVGPYPFGRRLVLDPALDRVMSARFAGDTANMLGQRSGQNLPVELVPGDSAGYKLGLIRLANTLREDGHTGNVRLALEAIDRLGNIYRRPFDVSTDLWAYPDTSPK